MEEDVVWFKLAQQITYFSVGPDLKDVAYPLFNQPSQFCLLSAFLKYLKRRTGASKRLILTIFNILEIFFVVRA